MQLTVLKFNLNPNMAAASVLVLRPGIHCNAQNFGRCRKYSVIIVISATHGFYCYARLNNEIRVTHSEIVETDQDLSGTGIKRPLQTSSSNPPPPAEGDDQEQPSTSDMPDAEELMETTPAPSTMAEQLSG